MNSIIRLKMNQETKKYYAKVITMTKISYKRSQSTSLWTPEQGIYIKIKENFQPNLFDNLDNISAKVEMLRLKIFLLET